MAETEIKVAVYGCGRWGINHVKTASTLIGDNLKYVFDTNEANRKKISDVNPAITFVTDKSVIINDPTINAVIVATPAETHFALAKELLLAGKNVLVEKPITLHTPEARELVAIAAARQLKLMVGHVLLYHPAVLRLKQACTEGMIGKLQYVYSNRLNLGAIRSEENILWSFAPHDISIIQFLTESQPTSVEAKGASFVQNHIEDTTLTYLTYPNNIHAHIFVSWLHPFKEQRLVVIGEKGMIVFEDSAKQDKLKFYPKGFKRTDEGIEKFEGDFISLPFADAQPLTEEHRHFYDCVLHNKQPLTDGAHALDVLIILEKATERLNHG
jgi:UDP-2-acetamido-3-amino-2,3-dideoxy-glucuronate N-acetyltransferase